MRERIRQLFLEILAQEAPELLADLWDRYRPFLDLTAPLNLAPQDPEVEALLTRWLFEKHLESEWMRQVARDCLVWHQDKVRHGLVPPDQAPTTWAWEVYPDWAIGAIPVFLSLPPNPVTINALTDASPEQAVDRILGDAIHVIQNAWISSREHVANHHPEELASSETFAQGCRWFIRHQIGQESLAALAEHAHYSEAHIRNLCYALRSVVGITSHAQPGPKSKSP